MKAADECPFNCGWSAHDERMSDSEDLAAFANVELLEAHLLVEHGADLSATWADDAANGELAR
jgi:hypothetical protein